MMRMFPRLSRSSSKTSGDCDHIFFPVDGPDGRPIGQKCALCPQYNSLSAVLDQNQVWDAVPNMNLRAGDNADVERARFDRQRMAQALYDALGPESTEREAVVRDALTCPYVPIDIGPTTQKPQEHDHMKTVTYWILIPLLCLSILILILEPFGVHLFPN